MSIEDMRDLWRLAMGKPARRFRLPFTHRNEADPALDVLLGACLGRPGAVLVLAHEVARPGNTATLPYLVAKLQQEGPVEGTLERIWRALLTNMRARLSDDAVWLLSALAELPVTGLIEGAVAAMLGVNEPTALAELQVGDLVREENGRYRLPQEVRRAIQATTREEDRRAVAARAMPALLRFYRRLCDLWAARLEVDAEAARRWFQVSEPSFRPLYQATYSDELLGVVVDDLCAIADALARWYIRERLSTGLLTVHEGLHDLVLRVGWLDLAALAAIRKATADRMLGEFGLATRELDAARTLLEQVPNPRVRAELDARERVERALLAVDRGTGLPQAFEDLSRLHVVSPVVLINLAMLCLGREELDDALEHLLRAEELAQDTGDLGAEAHSVELQGAVLSHRNPAEAVRAWQLARATFARIGEKQGEARCLQHLGSAALRDEYAAGQLLRGNAEPVRDPEAAQVALDHLELAKLLRKDRSDLLEAYIEEARRRLGLED
jgi:tetratricopeptide (TPR) repeat protein